MQYYRWKLSSVLFTMFAGLVLVGLFKTTRRNNQIVEFINNDDATGKVHNVERRLVDGWDILYDEVALREQVENIHKNYYVQPKDENCIVRPPDCMIAGVAKTGTVELGDFMTIHPNIVTKNKPFIFQPARNFRPSAVSDMPCAFKDQISMAKAGYGYLLPNRPQELLKLNPNMKIIIIVREPISRMKSFLTFRPTYAEREVVENSEMLSKSIYKMMKDPSGTALDLSTYDTHFKKYLKAFKRDSILVLENIEFMHNPSEVFKKIEHFLGIKHFHSTDHFVINPESKFHCIRTLDHGKRMACYERNRGRNVTIQIDAKDYENLLQYFRPHNEKFFRMIGKRYNW